MSVIGVASLPARISDSRHLVDAAVQLLGEMLGFEEVRDPVERVVVDEDRAEQRLLGLDVVSGATRYCGSSAVWRLADRRRVGGHSVSRRYA